MCCPAGVFGKSLLVVGLVSKLFLNCFGWFVPVALLHQPAREGFLRWLPPDLLRVALAQRASLPKMFGLTALRC